MANEPERPIEKLLRDAARKRRDAAGAPFELHPATRRLLQGEVARRFAKPQREARSLALLVAHLWPRFAWGLSILAVLGVAVWLLLPAMRGNKPEALLARNQPASQAMPAKQPLPPAPTSPAVAPPPPAETPPMNQEAAAYADKSQAEPRGSARQLRAEEKQLAKDAVREPSPGKGVDELLPAAAPQGADRKRAAASEVAALGAARPQGPVGTVSGAYDERRYGVAPQPAPPASLPAAPAAPPPVASTVAAASPVAADESMKVTADSAGQPAYAYKSPPGSATANRRKSAPAVTDGLAKSIALGLKEDKSFSVAQRFTQVAAGSKKKAALADEPAPAQPVLASFQVEQTGSELRVVDADGSVYTGYVQVAAAARPARTVRLEAPAAAPAARAPKDAVEDRSAARLDSDQLARQTYYFHVTGTNRSLHKNVVFTGNLLPATPATASAPPITNLSAGTGLGGSQTRSTRQLALPLQNSRISGKVAIGNAKAVEISAEPARP